MKILRFSLALAILLCGSILVVPASFKTALGYALESPGLAADQGHDWPGWTSSSTAEPFALPFDRINCVRPSGPYMPKAGEISFNFYGYANPQRPFPGYVGPFQLGPVCIAGSGIVRASDGALISDGYIDHRDDLGVGRPTSHRTRWRVLRGLGVDSTDGVTVLRLAVQVVSSNYSQICPVYTEGVLTLTSDDRLLGPRRTRDGINTMMPDPFRRAADGGGACRTHVHGMNNENYSWTEPRFGGSGGGIRANVNIDVNASNTAACSITGRWRQSTPGISTSYWTFTHLGGNRYRAREQGSGSATGTAIMTGNKLRLDASTRGLTGYYIWTIGDSCISGSGDLTFTRGRRGTYRSNISKIGTTSSTNYRRYTNTGINASFDPNYFFRNVSSGTCTATCSKYSWCRAVEYLPSRRYCYLHRKSATKAKRGVEAYVRP